VDAVGVIVETSREAHTKAAAHLDRGHREVISKDCSEVPNRAVVVITAESKD
jgi:hypothetical protein